MDRGETGPVSLPGYAGQRHRHIQYSHDPSQCIFLHIPAECTDCHAPADRHHDKTLQSDGSAQPLPVRLLLPSQDHNPDAPDR